MKNLIASAPSKERLENLINKFYFSENWFVNDEGQAENRVTGKKVGQVLNKRKRWQFLL